MTPAETKLLTQTLAMYAAYYRIRLDDEVVRMYAEDLADLEFQTVRDALSKYRANPKNRTMPLPAMIREQLDPEVDPESAAREIAARIQAAIPKFGWPNGPDARKFIGEVGWGIVERQGGWAYICEHHGVTLDPMVFQAQVREQAKAALKYSSQAMEEAIGILPAGNVRPGLQSTSELFGVRALPPGRGER